MKKPTLLLIDADLIAYRAAAASEKGFDWDGDGEMAYASDRKHAVASVDGVVEEIVKRFRGKTRVVMALSDDEWNFRKDIDPTYKGNRKETRRPELLADMKLYIEENWEAVRKPGLEGDDVLGILSTHPKKFQGWQKVIISADKDLNTIPGHFLHYGKTQGRGREVSLEEADRFHLMQTLTGDPTDGYPGCPLVGGDMASKILDDKKIWLEIPRTLKGGPNKGDVRWEWKLLMKQPGIHTTWDTVVSCFNKAGLDEDHALTQARLARILRFEDYDFMNERPILWTPK